MEWKKFGIKERLGSAKKWVFKAFRLMGTSGEDSNVSPLVPVSSNAPCVLENLPTKYSLEAELRKAEGLDYLRRWLDRPK